MASSCVWVLGRERDEERESKRRADRFPPIIFEHPSSPVKAPHDHDRNEDTQIQLGGGEPAENGMVRGRREQERLTDTWPGDNSP